MTSHSMKKRNTASDVRRLSAMRRMETPGDPSARGRVAGMGDMLDAKSLQDRTPPGFSGVMSRVCEMVWPVWPDTASSEHGADLAGADDLTIGGGACGTAVSRHSILQRTPVAPVDQRRAACTPI
ncbi:protein of unknown function [Pararobbsia alpina]